jgi:hypothetical protein
VSNGFSCALLWCFGVIAAVECPNGNDDGQAVAGGGLGRHKPCIFLLGSSSSQSELSLVGVCGRLLACGQVDRWWCPIWLCSMTIDEVYPRQCPCRRAFDLGSVLGTWRTRRRSDKSKGTQDLPRFSPLERSGVRWVEKCLGSRDLPPSLLYAKAGSQDCPSSQVQVGSALKPTETNLT